MLAKKSNVMSDQLVIESSPSGDAIIHNLLLAGPGSAAIHQATMPLDSYLAGLLAAGTADSPQMFGLAPSGLTVRSLFQRHGVMVFLIEVPPGTRTLRWLCDDSPQPYGTGATYRNVTIALPYLYFFVAVRLPAELTQHQSVYFLHRSLQSLDEPLGDCHFYNCSVNAYDVHCWICTQSIDQHLPKPLGATPLDRVSQFIQWFFASSFNASSEHHEGQSFWGMNHTKLKDRRVTTISQWEKASAMDPNFVLAVPWQPSLTARQVFSELTPAFSGRPKAIPDLVRLMH